MNKKHFLLYKNLFSRINHHQLLNEYVLHIFFAFYQHYRQEQLKTIQQAEKKKNALTSWEFALCH